MVDFEGVLSSYKGIKHMDWFEPDAKKKAEERKNDVQYLAGQLEAEYCSTLMINELKNRFNSISKITEIENSNIIVGNIEGYDYCLVEYYHIRRGKGDHSGWRSKLIFRTKGSIPDFRLLTKKSAISTACIGLFFGLLFLIIPICIILSGKGGATIPAILSIVISLIILYCAVLDIKEIYENDKYGIRNSRFKEKYIIRTEASPNDINRVFTEEVCSKILNYPSDIDIEINEQEIFEEFELDEKLSYPLCKKHLNSLISKVKILEGDSELL